MAREALAVTAAAVTGERAAAAVAGDGQRAVFTAPPRPPALAGLPGGEFAAGAVFGAAVALLGALVGGLVARRGTRDRRRQG